MIATGANREIMLAASPEVSVGRVKHPCDVYLLTALAGLVILGLVMVASASVTAAEKEGRDTPISCGARPCR